ncbi:hypothetical protein HZA56_11465 [Candidatus Poribacteria bacterium]|nr:hypothetical protein [Candidatus Poribacteria bacterium]
MSPMVLGLAVGIVIGVMDFSLARSFASLVRPSTMKIAMAIVVGGFLVRLTAIGFMLWLLSHATNVSFTSACAGLVGSFTVLTLLQPLKVFGTSGRAGKQASDRR